VSGFCLTEYVCVGRESNQTTSLRHEDRADAIAGENSPSAQQSALIPQRTVWRLTLTDFSSFVSENPLFRAFVSEGGFQGEVPTVLR
jgi:hypothetical protein